METNNENMSKVFSSDSGIVFVEGLESMRQIIERIEDEIENVLSERTDALKSVMVIAHLNNVRKKAISDLCHCEAPKLPMLEGFKAYLKENYKLLYNRYKSMLSN